METIWNIGITWNIFFQSLGSWLKTPMEIISFLGTENFFLLLIPALYWCVETSIGIRVAVILLLSASVNDSLKMFFHDPRPYWYSTEVIAYAKESSFGLPSGHAQIAFSVWGMLANGIHKWWGWFFAILIILLIGISRLYLGVHFPHDIIIGWLVGALLLFLVVWSWKQVIEWLKKMSFRQQIIASFLGSLAIILLYLTPFLWLKITNWQPPSAWAEYASSAVSIKAAFTTAGTLFGLLIGLVWLNHQGGFDTNGSLGKRVLRYMLGLIGVIVFYIGLKVLFGLLVPDEETLLSYILRYARYVLVGAWISAGAPWFFIKLGLARRSA